MVRVLSVPYTAVTFARLGTWPSVRKSRRLQTLRSALQALPAWLLYRLAEIRLAFVRLQVKKLCGLTESLKPTIKECHSDDVFKKI